MSTKENLTEALGLLRTRGWLKHSLGRSYCGYCSLGAIYAANTKDVDLKRYLEGYTDAYAPTPESEVLQKAIVNLHGDGYLNYDDSSDAVTQFNDRVALGFAEIEAVFEKAIELASITVSAAAGTIFTEAAEPGVLRVMRMLADIRPEIDTRTTGTREYKAGAIYTTDTDSIQAILADFQANMWILWDDTYLRISSVVSGADGREHQIECSQAADVGAALIDGRPAVLRIVEPSPPRPVDEWLPAERARAIRDLVGDARPTVLVPDHEAKTWIPCDPWAVTE